MQVIEGGEGDCNAGDKPLDVTSSNEFNLVNMSQNGNLNNTVNHFNAFANSFHVNEEVRVSEVLPKLTEDMLKIEDDE